MSSYYEEVDLLDMTLENEENFTSPCPCGDKFFIPLEDLLDNEDEAGCPSCSLILKVKYDADYIREKFMMKQQQQLPLSSPAIISENISTVQSSSSSSSQNQNHSNTTIESNESINNTKR
jgi:diphthamide biosynthesis protein 3